MNVKQAMRQAKEEQSKWGCWLFLYHTWFGDQPYGRERDATHFHIGKALPPFHVDYCFIPVAWVRHITKVDVGTFAEWHTISDHAPVTVELSL